MNSWSLFGKTPALVTGEARLADAGALAAIHATGFERGWGIHEFEALLADRLVVGHIGRFGEKGRINSFILSRLVLDEAEILTIAVAPSARNGGVATSLLTHHLGRIAGAGARKMFLEVAQDNMAALALYRRFGFRQTGMRNAYYKRSDGCAAAAILMERSLV